MNELKLYKNSKPYPYYSNSISLYKTLQITPRNQDIKSGYVDIQLTLDECLNFNYISYIAGTKTVYAWVDNIEEMGGNLNKRVHFTVDALRTYKSNLVLGNQFVLRSPTPTIIRDDYLGSSQPYNDISIYPLILGDVNKRIAVVQVRGDSGQIMSNTPGQPTPYQFWFCEYNVNNWNATAPIANLLAHLIDKAQTSNIVTIYSIPYIDLTGMEAGSLPVILSGGETFMISGWYLLHSTDSPYRKFRTVRSIDVQTWRTESYTLTSHNFSIIVPEGGVLNIPDEIAYYSNPAIVREVDVFSGACNYMLTLDDGMFPTHISCRGSSLSSIPILSDPYDTYVSQNQNSLAVGLLGDVANVALGVGTGNIALAGIGGAGLIGKLSNQADAQNMIPSNPPTFLGSALVSEYNNRVFLSIVAKPYDNASEVHARYGYPLQKLTALAIPGTGYIQTDNCSVSSDGSVPLWAIQEINSLFNGGLLFS